MQTGIYKVLTVSVSVLFPLAATLKPSTNIAQCYDIGYMGACFSIVKFFYTLKIFHKENLKARKSMLPTVEHNHMTV